MKIFLPSILAVVIASVLFISVLPKLMNRQIPQNDSVQSTPNTKTFKSSEVMKFSVELPSGFTGSEGHGSAVLSTSDGSILILQNGTDFMNLDSYILNSKNDLKTRLKETEQKNIYGLESIRGYLDNEKIYFIYSPENHTVYSISTKSKELHDKLDQIAQSFRYTP